MFTYIKYLTLHVRSVDHKGFSSKVLPAWRLALAKERSLIGRWRGENSKDNSTSVQFSFLGEQKLEEVQRQTGPSVQKKNLAMLRAAIVTVMLSVVQDSSVDLTTAKTSMKMLTV